MADWGKIIRGVAGFAAGIVRAAVVDFDPATRQLWISQLAISQALRMRNERVGFFGLLVDVHVLDGYGIRVDVTTRPLGTQHAFILSGGCVCVEPDSVAFMARVIEADAEVSLIMKAMPYVAGVLLGLRGSQLAPFEEDGLIGCVGPLQYDAWFVQLVRSLGGLQRGAVLPIMPGEQGIVIDLSELAVPGVVLDVGTVAQHMQLNAGRGDG